MCETGSVRSRDESPGKENEKLVEKGAGVELLTVRKSTYTAHSVELSVRAEWHPEILDDSFKRKLGCLAALLLSARFSCLSVCKHWHMVGQLSHQMGFTRQKKTK